MSSGKRERSRSRSPMEERRRDSRERSRSPRRTRIPRTKRIVISNIPYDLKWQEIKDLFRREVGDVTYVELFNAPDGKPKGSGVIEFKDIDKAALAIDRMHRYEIKDRKIVVREEKERERRQHEMMSSRGGGAGGGMGGMGGGGMGGGGLGGMGGMGGGQGMMGPGPGMGMGGGGGNMGSGDFGGMGGGNSLNPQVLQQLGVDGPLTNAVFISNLDYKVTWKKLKDVFRLAGNVVRAEIKEDKDGKSRGMGTVTFEKPAEALQAISMFNNQSLYDRTMRVKMDGQVGAASRPEPLPSGLKSIGPSLNNLQMNPMDMGMGMSTSGMGMGSMGMDNMRGMGMGNMDSNRMGSGMSGMGMSGMGGGMSGMASMNSSMSGMGGMSGMGSMGSGMGLSDSFSGMSGLSGMGSSGMGSTGLGGLNDNYGMSSMGMGGGSSYSGMMDTSRGSLMGGFSSQGSGRSDFGRGDRERGDRGGGSLSGGDMKTRADKSTIIVKNLPYAMDWQTLKTRFQAVGDIRFAEISKDDRGKSQGWGLISFRREEDAKLAVQKMNRVNLDGREVVVKLLN